MTLGETAVHIENDTAADIDGEVQTETELSGGQIPGGNLPG